MSFAANEASHALGEPIDLYQFIYGDGVDQVLGYSNAEIPITLPPSVTGLDADVTFMPIAIDRGKISSSGTLDKVKLDVTTTADSAIAQLYIAYPPSKVTTLVIRQGHVNDPDQEYKVIWSGRVLSCARKGSTGVFSCEPVSTSLRRNGLKRRYQYGCPLALYGIGPGKCNADKAAATLTVAAVDVSGIRVTLAPGWATNAIKYVGGITEWVNPVGNATEIRTIIRLESNNTVLVLSGPARGLVAGQTFSAILGCNHKSGTPAQPDGDCGPLHDNVLNFGGQERIPYTNPISIVNNYY